MGRLLLYLCRPIINSFGRLGLNDAQRQSHRHLHPSLTTTLHLQLNLLLFSPTHEAVALSNGQRAAPLSLGVSSKSALPNAARGCWVKVQEEAGAEVDPTLRDGLLTGGDCLLICVLGGVLMVAVRE